MNEYNPPYQITNQILKYVSIISEKIGKISVNSRFESKPRLRRNNKIRSIHSSLRIEANSLSLNEVRDVIDGKIVLGKAKEIQEVKNAYEAYEKISSINPYSLDDLQYVHGILTQFIEKESGIFRTGEEGVFKGEECIFMAPPAKFVPHLMNELFEWMNNHKNNVHPLILAAVFHYEFVFIHPFADGNGRMARLWHTTLLTQWKPLFEYIPLESQIEKFQEEYYDAIANCHKEGNCTLFIEFILNMINQVLDEVYKQNQLNENYISEYVKKLVDIMEYDTPYTANQLLILLDLKSKDMLRKNYINPAIESGLIVMTLPHSPRSKNQRYMKC